MQGTVDGFSYGTVTPLTAYVMACLGAALGLRCITRSLRNDQSWKPGWLALGAASIGCGIWTMHFIAMIGFQVEESRIRYDVGLTILSLAVAIAVVGLGVFAVGYRGASTPTLLLAGAFTGFGVAAMHYIGMAAIRVNGDLRYEARTVALSVLIAVVAATAALWAAVAIRGFLTSLAASLVMGVAVTGMHYTGMAAVSVHLHGAAGTPDSGDSAHSLLLPMLIGPVLFLALAGVVVMFDPMLVLGDGDWNRTASRRRTPPPATEPPAWSGSAFEAPPRTDRRAYEPGGPGGRNG
ncbi:MHYT domain-containing protein [Streptomyces sp. NPDC017991]|uniref:MHYT domain-containing protein n=1 Tax=Streptomyces sp. NPDC017991 TaxID=3365026 RepID=UPI003790F721